MDIKKNITSLVIDGMDYGSATFWMEYEYKDEGYPLLFVSIPNLDSRHIVGLLKVFDKLYGDTDQETTEWALEYQLLTRLLITQNQLLVNPKHLDLSETDTMQDVLDEIPESDRAVYLSARTISLKKIREAFEQRYGIKLGVRNTCISYLYRDASNYKVHNTAIIKGELTENQQKIILGCLDEGEYFIPSQVGLPEEKFGSETEDDHCWFELGKGFASLCKQKPTVDITAEELTTNFLLAMGKWIGQ